MQNSKWRVFKGNDPRWVWEIHKPNCEADKSTRNPSCLEGEDTIDVYQDCDAYMKNKFGEAIAWAQELAERNK